MSDDFDLDNDTADVVDRIDDDADAGDLATAFEDLIDRACEAE